MNERLDKLDDAAQEYAGRIAGNDEDSNYNAWFNIYKKKFAELIVRECANVAADHDALDIYEEIRQHFGVEE
jgi:hypothetical protein